MSDNIETQEVGRGRCGGGYVQPCGGQQYYQDWRMAQPRFRPDARICQPYGQPMLYGGCNDGSCTGPYWDRARQNENENQMQYWGAKREDNLVRDARGKVIDADYGDGTWAHSPWDSNSVTVHRHGRTEHWVTQQDGSWRDQISGRSLSNRDVNYDPRTGKLVIEGETYDPKKPKPSDTTPDVPPPAPEVDDAPATRGLDKRQLMTELQKSPFDRERVFHLLDGMSSQDKIALLRDTTRDTAAAVRGASAETAAAAQEINRRAHEMLGRVVLPEVLNSPWDAAKLKGLMTGMTVAERFGAMADAIKLADTLKPPQNVPADLAAGTPDQRAAKARGAMGFMSADLAKEYEAQKTQTTDQARLQKLNELAGQCKWRAIEWIMNAGHLNGTLYNDAAFSQAVQGAGLPGDSANFILQKGKESPNWFFPTRQEIDSGNPNAFQDAYDRAKAQIGAAMRRNRTETAPAPRPAERPNPTPPNPANPDDLYDVFG